MGNGMNSANVLYSHGANDECYTPAYAVEPILKYIPKNAVVWCPFDKLESEFVQMINKKHRIVRSHIDGGMDFLKKTPVVDWDVIVSNPPFTNKRAFFQRAIDLGKPFALLMSNTWLNDAAPKQLFKDVDLQLLMFEQRIKYKGQGDKITFSSSYYCRDFLPKQIIMERLAP
jgi:hypothetical protein